MALWLYCFSALILLTSGFGPGYCGMENDNFPGKIYTGTHKRLTFFFST